jgi:predicted ATPase
VARARCYAAHGQLAYAPVAEWLRATPLRTSCAQLPLSQLTELARVLPEILAGNDAIERPGPLTESWERHHFYDALNTAFGKARKPLLLMIDDLQWCDPDSFEWLHSLFRSHIARGILVLATARPEETGRSHPFSRLLGDLQQSGQAIELPLDPLTAGETGELAALVSEHPLDSAALAGLYGSSKGNPLFVLESLRAGLGNAAPSRIHAVIVARLAQLSPRAYELAGLASTIGSAFSFDLLAKATDWDEESVSNALDELWQRRIIVGGDQAGQYDFTHDRLREVAYAELSPVRRRFLHRRVARALEELNGASGQVAAHYDAAGMPEPAIRHYQIAAGVARQRYADTEAAGLLRRALSLCRDFPEGAARDRQELDLLVLLGLAMVTTQGYAMPEAGEIYERALVLCRRLGESQHLFSVLSGCWSFNIVSGRLAPGFALAQEFLDLAVDRPNVTASHLLPMAGHFVLGSSHFHLGQFVQSELHLRKALEAEAGRPHSVLTLFAGPDIGVFCKAYLSQVLWHLGRLDESLQASREVLAAADALSHPFSVALARNYAAILHLFRDESRQALGFASEAAAVCRKYGFAYYLSMAEILAGSAQSAEGYPEAGLARLREGLDALKATGAQVRLPFYHGLLAQACARAGRAGEALAHVSIALAFQGHSGEIWAGSDLQRIHGDLLLQNGDRQEARLSYQRAIDAAREAGSQSWELRARNALAACDDFGTQASAATERF